MRNPDSFDLRVQKRTVLCLLNDGRLQTLCLATTCLAHCCDRSQRERCEETGSACPSYTRLSTVPKIATRQQADFNHSVANFLIGHLPGSALRCQPRCLDEKCNMAIHMPSKPKRPFAWHDMHFRKMMKGSSLVPEQGAAPC